MRKLSLIVIVSLLFSGFASPLLARDNGPKGDRGRQIHPPRAQATKRPSAPPPARKWRGDIHRFKDHDYAYWRSGHWKHGHHEGRNGWWWIVGSTWYFYNAPVYPYPDPYTPAGHVVVPGSSVYYYCTNPAGYYPYVPYCAAWQKIAPQSAAPSTVVVAQPARPESPRDVDYRELNTLADEFYHIDYRKPSASTQLKNLGKRVEAFRKSLLERTYNAMDVLRDAEDLKERIAAQRGALSLGNTKPPPLPAGTKVVFPPH